MGLLNDLSKALCIGDLDETRLTESDLKKPKSTISVILRTEEQIFTSIRVDAISACHIRLSGDGLPVRLHSVVEMEIFDDMLRMIVQATVESKDSFGLTARFVQPGNLFQDWIASIVD